MTSYFPPIFQDELLYSVFARYHQRSGNVTYKESLFDLFNKSTTSAISDFPGDISVLCENIGFEKLNPLHLINNHTLLPYYLHFIREDHGNKIKHQMVNDNSTAISVTLGLAASKIKETNFFRFCISCFNEEIAIYGEPYWHRTHQLPGVVICPKHKETLFVSHVPYRNKQNKHSFFSLDKNSVRYSKKISIQKNFYKYFEFIAVQSYRLLNESQLLIGIEDIRNFYLEKLKTKGYLTPSKRLRMKEIISSFLSSFEPGFLETLDSNFSADEDDTWFHKVLRKPRVACHPLRHLLLLLFLKEDMPNVFFKDDMEYHPFGKGPWPCLNKAVDHFKDPIISDCIVTTDSKTKQPVGTFVCNQCYFSYSRRGPDITEHDRYKIGRVKNFGDQWENKLNELNSLGKHSIRNISFMMGVDSKTVKRHLENNKGKNYVDPKKTESEESDKNRIEEKYRRDLITLKNNNPDFNRTELRRANPAVYTWLYRKDKDWLLSNLPLSKRSYKPVTKINWAKRDEEYSILLIKEAVNIFTEIPLIRVTKTRLAKRLDLQARFENYMNKLPMCKNIFTDVTETVEDFQIRRIIFIGEKFRRENTPYTKSSLARGARLNKNLSKKVENVLVEELSYIV
ncbi:TnsD family Tn7-like transposition protein [Cytobacillus praedii]|uniref:TnsD family Tn7-like transposition protein n=1 Tax=Cytobacillus praedii TaxID=1742358 RepID=UPI00070FC98C|nr:TnsD family Tn7-like transposition protein [Cytobacillus praedii]